MHNFFFKGNVSEPIIKSPIKDQDGFFIDCENPIGSREYSKGKSFRCWNWKDNQGRTFVNDAFYQDFVIYNGELYVCVNNTHSVPGTSEDWILAVKQIEGRIFFPIVDSYGNLSWTLYEDQWELPEPTNIKGPKGDKGDTGPKGNEGPMGPRGPKGDSGNGNMDIGYGEPLYTGSANDVYLDIKSGTFFKYINEWKNIGQISVEGTSFNIEWKDE